MTLKDIKEDFYIRSSSTSAIVRQLALAGVAITWLFKSDDPVPRVAGELGHTLMLFVGTIGLDLAHAIIPTILYGILHLVLDARHKGDETAVVEYPGWMTVPAWFFFFAKIIMLIWAYWSMHQYLHSAAVFG